MKRQSGFTLIEILIATAIASASLALVTYFTVDLSRSGIFLGDRLETERELEMALRALVSEGRSIGPGENGAYPIVTANGTTFTFFSDVDGDGTFEQVRYFLEGTILKKGVTEPTATEPITYPAGNEVVREIVHSIVPGTLFAYYPSGYPLETGQLPNPIDVASIRLVSVTATTDKDTSRPPLPTTLSINITIRNLRGEI